MTDTNLFLHAACVPTNAPHVSGTLAEADALLSAHPELASIDVYTAAVLGDEGGVRRFLASDPALATAAGGPHGWDALTHLCFSRYLRLDPARSQGFVRAATALLDAGANPNGGWHEADGTWESVLYGAAGVAHHEELTRLLLGRGADPNDGETPYHAPESRDLGVIHALLESGKLTPESLSWLLVRKSDWHDADGLRVVLEHGADPNHLTRWGVTPLQHAVRRDNSADMIALLLDHGGDPARATAHAPLSAAAVAARRGRSDVLALLDQRGIRAEDAGADALLAACARGDLSAARLHARDARVETEGASALAEFAGNGNAAGVACLIELGVPVNAPYAEGDAYFGIPAGSTALHVAAWRARHQAVAMLLARGASPAARDALGRTPLMLAVRAGVDSYWAAHRRPDSVAALLAAGASTSDVAVPTGWPEVDALLAAGSR